MDVALKQRLVGASVLIALAVIVLPMMLGGRPEDGATETQRIELPPQPGELDFETRRFPVGDAAAPVGSQPHAAAEPSTAPGPRDLAHVELQPRDFEDALADGQAEPDAPATESGEEPGTTPVEEPGTLPPPADAAAETALEPPAAPEAAAAPPVTTATPTQGRYVVQVASFGAVENANRLAATLKGYGYSILTDVVSSDVGKLHRVRVGPYSSEAEAVAATTRLKSQVADVRPRVVDLRPEQAAQVTSPSDPLVRWVVQAGSFGSEENADTLVGKLRELGLSAYKEAVGSGGSTIYRVRAGPFVERDEAIRANGLVKERLSLDGVVMSAD